MDADGDAVKVQMTITLSKRTCYLSCDDDIDIKDDRRDWQWLTLFLFMNLIIAINGGDSNLGEAYI